MAKDTDDNNETKYYCGIGPVPRGKERGTMEYCIRTNQVRYWGVKAIPAGKLDEIKGNNSTGDLTKELIKSRKFEHDAKLLLKELANVNAILSQDGLKEKKKVSLQKKKKELIDKGKELKKKMLKQRKVVENLEKEIAETEKNKKTTKKTIKKNSGSKSSTKKKNK